jgi:hypothetical protein
MNARARLTVYGDNKLNQNKQFLKSSCVKKRFSVYDLLMLPASRTQKPKETQNPD